MVRILSSRGGFCTVRGETGETILCRLRGRFRRDGLVPLPGDFAEISKQGDQGRIDEIIMPRKNTFVRPALANLDCLIIAASLAPPVSEYFWVDAICAAARNKNIEPIICYNKSDLIYPEEQLALYKSLGFLSFAVSAETGEGLDALLDAIGGKLSAFAGHSGVGKSSLMNRLASNLQLPTGEVSEKLGRGRHTTRHTEIFDLGGGTLIADTPGFSAFDPEQMQLSKTDLRRAFGEFQNRGCRFDDCDHIASADCAVRGAVENGEIFRSRYDSFVKLADILSRRG